MKSINKNLVIAFAILVLLNFNSCDNSADTYGGNNPKSGYVEIDTADDVLIVAENIESISIPLILNTSINPVGVNVNYTIEASQGSLPSGFEDKTNGTVTIKSGENTGSIEMGIPITGNDYSFRATLTAVNDTDFSIGISDNSKITTVEVFVGNIDDIIATIDENPVQGFVLTQVASNFPSSTTFSITDESIDGAFGVDPDTGELFVSNPFAFDWETYPTLQATVKIESGSTSVTKTVIINLNDINIFWTGPMITFTYDGDGDATLPANQDRLTDNVWLGRGPEWPIYNVALENTFIFGSPYSTSISPRGTLWAVGSISDGVENLTFGTFAAVVGSAYNYINSGGNPPLVVYLINDDTYLDLTWIDWHRGNGNDGGLGGFSYLRSTPL